MLFLYAIGLLLVHLWVLLAPLAPSASLCSGALSLALVAAAGCLRTTTHRYAWFGLLVVTLAYVNASVRLDLRLQNRLAHALDGAEVTVVGSVATLPVRFRETLRFELDRVESETSSVVLPERLQVSWYRSARLPAAGERWRMRLRLQSARGALNPGGADVDGWFLRKGIGARASVIDHEAERVPGSQLDHPVLRIRARVALRVAATLDGEAVAGLVTGLAVGLRTAITASQWAILKQTGTGHLVAISGLHVGLVAGLVYWLARYSWSFSRRLSSWLSPVDAARPLAMLAASVYALLAGFGLPTRRALLMLGLLYLARATRRPLGGGRLLMLALLAFLALDPLGLLSAGFWLSFLAVATLLLAVGNNHGNRFWLLVKTQGTVFVGLAPVTMAAFSQVPLVAPLANLIMIPLFSLMVVPLVLAAVVAMAIGLPLADLLLRAAALLLETAWQLLAWLAEDGWQWRPHLSRPQWIALLLGSVGLLLPRWPGRAGLLGVAVLSLLLAPAQQRAIGSYRLTILDIGHGLSVVVSTAGHTLVYDLGKGVGERSSFNRVLQPYLQGATGWRPDLLVLSHDDAQHLGDLPGFLRAYPGAGLLTGAPQALTRRYPGASPLPCAQGQSWQWDGVLFEILQPGREIVWEDDDSSCVLRVSGGGTVALLTGDLTQRGEARLLERYPDLRADVVVGLGHGSRRSSSPELIERLRARLAVFSTAASNPWRLPAAEVLARWQAAGVRVAVTGAQGAISIDTADGLTVVPARRGRAWHRH